MRFEIEFPVEFYFLRAQIPRESRIGFVILLSSTGFSDNFYRSNFGIVIELKITLIGIYVWSN